MPSAFVTKLVLKAKILHFPPYLISSSISVAMYILEPSEIDRKGPEKHMEGPEQPAIQFSFHDLTRQFFFDLSVQSHWMAMGLAVIDCTSCFFLPPFFFCVVRSHGLVTIKLSDIVSGIWEGKYTYYNIHIITNNNN